MNFNLAFIQHCKVSMRHCMYNLQRLLHLVGLLTKLKNHNDRGVQMCNEITKQK